MKTTWQDANQRFNLKQLNITPMNVRPKHRYFIKQVIVIPIVATIIGTGIWYLFASIGKLFT